MLPDSDAFWSRLKYLFRAVIDGNPPLSIATFNGGLFDSRKLPFLEQYAVGDVHLRHALDKLARVDGQFIDYRDLDMRHMGTIYEGLQEYKLVPSGTGVSPVGLHGRDCYATIDDAFTIDLLTDKGERKATGSYYTPDYIVKFIVERAVGPALREAVAGAASKAAKVRAVLEVNVLDPAMDSGHFLVEATENIARFLVDQGIAPEGKTPETESARFPPYSCS